MFQLEHICKLIVTHLDYWCSTCYSPMVCSACLSAPYPEGNWYLRHWYEHFRMSAKLMTHGFDPTTSYNPTLFFTAKFSVLKDFLWWTVPYLAAFVSFEQTGKWNAGLYSILFLFRHNKWRTVSYPIRYSLPKEVLWPWQSSQYRGIVLIAQEQKKKLGGLPGVVSWVVSFMCVWVKVRTFWFVLGGLSIKV